MPLFIPKGSYTNPLVKLLRVVSSEFFNVWYALAWVIGFFAALCVALLIVTPMGVLTFIALKEILEFLKPLVQQ